METPVRACFKLDDFPACPIYQMRAQARAFGYEIPDEPHVAGWEEMDRVPLWPLADLEEFADFADEFDLRGKFTCLPFPAGFGRLDQHVRGYSDEQLQRILDIVRLRIGPRFDITPEVMTHTMAVDAESGALLPHAESHWMAYLARTGQVERMVAYIHKAYEILSNVGLRPHGYTSGGMPDVSGISAGQSLMTGHNHHVLGEAIVAVDREFNPGARTSVAFTGSPPVHEKARNLWAPETIYTSQDGIRVYHFFSLNDPAWYLRNGRGDVEAAINQYLTEDLTGGAFIAAAEEGRAIVLTAHTFTLNCNGTHIGMRAVREIVGRLHKRYGDRLRWYTATELAEAIGV